MANGKTMVLVGTRAAQLHEAGLSAGFVCIGSEDAVEALALLAREGALDVALVVIDLTLEDMETREFLRQARPHCPHASYLLLANPAEAGMIVSNLIHGADSYIPIPVDPQALPGVLHRHAAAAVGRMGTASGVAALEQALHEAKAENARLAESRQALATKNAELAVSVDQLLEEVQTMVAAQARGVPGRESSRPGTAPKAQRGRRRRNVPPIARDEEDDPTETVPIVQDKPRPTPESTEGLEPWHSPTAAEPLSANTEVDSDAATGADEGVDEPAGNVGQMVYDRQTKILHAGGAPAGAGLLDELISPTEALPAKGPNLSRMRGELSDMFGQDADRPRRAEHFDDNETSDPANRPPRLPPNPTQTKQKQK